MITLLLVLSEYTLFGERRPTQGKKKKKKSIVTPDFTRWWIRKTVRFPASFACSLTLGVSIYISLVPILLSDSIFSLDFSLSIHLSLCLFIYQTTYPFIYQLISLFNYRLPTYLFICRTNYLLSLTDVHLKLRRPSKGAATVRAKDGTSANGPLRPSLIHSVMTSYRASVARCWRRNETLRRSPILTTIYIFPRSQGFVPRQI